MELKTLKEHVERNGLKVINGSFIEFNKNSTDFQILPNFKLHELLTKDKSGNRYTLIDLNVLIDLQIIRNEFGSPIGISSSFRSEAYNRSQNGATSSEHKKGRALDIYSIKGYTAKLKAVVRKVKKTGGRGLNYNTFVHIDTGRTRTW